MGFFGDLANAFNGNARNRYDFIHNKVSNILQYRDIKKFFYSGTQLDREQKIITFVFLNGLFYILTYQYELGHHYNKDLNDIENKALGLQKLYMKDKLSWSNVYIDMVIKDVQNYTYNNPQHIQGIYNIGIVVAVNLTIDSNIASMINTGGEISEANGYRVLDDFIDLLYMKN
jgi:hypothetical protein